MLRKSFSLYETNRSSSLIKLKVKGEGRGKENRGGGRGEGEGKEEGDVGKRENR